MMGASLKQRGQSLNTVQFETKESLSERGMSQNIIYVAWGKGNVYGGKGQRYPMHTTGGMTE